MGARCARAHNLMELMEARRIILTQGESLGYVYSSVCAYISETGVAGMSVPLSAALFQHFIREKVSEGLIKLTFVPTKEEAADGLTKPLAGEAFVKFIQDLGLETV